MRDEVTSPRANWAGNYRYGAFRIYYPETVEQVCDIIHSTSRVKAVGTRHSFNGIADSDGVLISLERLEPYASIDRETSTVTISGGTTYGQLCAQLDAHGFALRNLASLPDISIAGACSTGTHGSGNGNGCLSTSVAAVKIVNGRGEVVSMDRSQESFAGSVVSLGALGIIIEMTLDIVPAFRIRQNVFRNLPFHQLERSFDEITGSAHSVSLFTDWQNRALNQAWLKLRDTESAPESTFFGADPAQFPIHPLEGLPVENCTEQMGIGGPWHERIPHFRTGCLPSSGDELQTEYFIDRKHTVEALHAIERLRDLLAPTLQISEVRTIAADDLWLSPCYGRDSVAFHFTWRNDALLVRNLLPRLESALSPFDARPHWGKLFTLGASEIARLYPRINDFRVLTRFHDPDGRFRNPFLESLALTDSGP